MKKRSSIAIDPCLEVDTINVDFFKAARSVSLPVDAVEKINQTDYNQLYHFPLKDFVAFLLLTGARIGEALHAEPEDFNLKKKNWVIKKKPKYPTTLEFGWRPKNNNPRIVPLVDEVIDILAPLIAQAKKRQIVGYIKSQEEPVAASFIFSMIDRKLTTRRRDVRDKKMDSIQVWRRVDKNSKAWKSLFIIAGLCVLDVDNEGRFKVIYTRHDARRGWNEEAEKLGLNLKERSAIFSHELRVNRRNYNGEKHLDLESIFEKIQTLRA